MSINVSSPNVVFNAFAETHTVQKIINAIEEGFSKREMNCNEYTEGGVSKIRVTIVIRGVVGDMERRCIRQKYIEAGWEGIVFEYDQYAEETTVRLFSQ